MNRSKNKKNKKSLLSSTMTPVTNTVTVTRTQSVVTPTSKSSKKSSSSNPTTPVTLREKNHHIFPEPKKIERSNSFVISKLTDFYHKVRGSQDNLNKIEPQPQRPPPAFLSATGRSQTLAEISSTRKSYRRSIREPKLEELQEEHDTTIDTPIIEEPTSPVVLRRNSREDDEPSKGLLSRLKRTFSIKPDRRKSFNSNWSTSLQSLQNIDTMVSYEDLRFIDYDKFNTYEKQINQRISLTVSQKSINQPNKPESSPPSPQHALAQTKQHISEPLTSPIIIEPPRPFPPSFPTIDVRRRPKKKRVVSQFDATYEKNFDAGRNLYRQSFDRRTLEHFKDINRDSFRMSGFHDLTDSLLLDNYLEGKSTDQVDDVAKKENTVSYN